MLRLIKTLLRAVGVDTTSLYQRLSAASVVAAAKEAGTHSLFERMEEIVPDLISQYTKQFDRTEYERYWKFKLRGLHAFQIKSVLDTLELIGGRDMTLVDIGDSAGTHAKIIAELAPAQTVKDIVSVNLDPGAIAKIKERGGKAILGRAEKLHEQNINADLYTSFEMVEHLLDPIGFFRNLAAEGRGDRILFSVPYVKKSRFGGYQLRNFNPDIYGELTPENFHIFELNPEDWEYLVRFAGFKTVFRRIYYQYPRRGLLRLMQPLWKKLDFEGFLIIYAERDDSIAKLYSGW
jgi:2-polyprenyl-3-methyl-5-hydroxy-6-metoxy-1,4-benzoquinol methylase